MDLWTIYYQHWARETNQIRLYEFKKKSVIKLNQCIQKWIYKDKPFTNSRVLLDYVLQIFPQPGYWYSAYTVRSGIKIKMKLLKELATILFPSSTPDDFKLFMYPIENFIVKDSKLEKRPHSPSFLLPPLEIRFYKNTNLPMQCAMKDLKLSYQEIHRLESILALF